MDHPMLLDTMIKRSLGVAIAAAFVSGCAAMQPLAQLPTPTEPVSQADPSGPADPSAAAGAQGPDSTRGRTGPAGVPEVAGRAEAEEPSAGPIGRPGAASVAGARGAQAPTGTQGSIEVAAIGGWSVYRDYSFYPDSNGIVRSDENKTLEIAHQLERNPSLRVGLDGANSMRVGNVRDALIKAGVPPYKILVGDFGDPKARRDSRVAVLLRN